MKTSVLQAFKHATLLKETLTQVFACNIAKFLRIAFFYKRPLGVGSAIYSNDRQRSAADVTEYCKTLK